MNDNLSLIEKLSHFLRGKPAPAADTGLSITKQIDKKSRLNLATEQIPIREISLPTDNKQPDETPTINEPALGLDDLSKNLDDLSNQVRKLGKTQFKTNSLYEAQLTQQTETLESLQTALNQQDKRWTTYDQQQTHRVEAAQLALIESLLPVLDGLDAAFYTGAKQILTLPMEANIREATIAWLDGVRLARIRFLDILATHHVKPIPTVNHPFDPHLHVAVATDSSGKYPNGTIISQDRVGYATPNKVLRFAEVVVAQSANKNSQSAR